jgi:hypothetical protein
MTNSIHNDYASTKIYSKLISACRSGNIEKIKKIIKTDDFFYALKLPDTLTHAFHAACSNKKINAITFLLDNFNISVDKYKIGICGAASSGSVKTVAFLLNSEFAKKNNIKIDETFEQPILNACNGNHLKLLKFFLSKPNTNSFLKTHDNCLYVSVINNEDVTILKYLLEEKTFEKLTNIHFNHDKVFKYCCSRNKQVFLTYLITEYQINKTDDIENYLLNGYKTERIEQHLIVNDDDGVKFAKKLFLTMKLNAELNDNKDKDIKMRIMPKKI